MASSSTAAARLLPVRRWCHIGLAAVSAAVLLSACGARDGAPPPGAAPTMPPAEVGVIVIAARQAAVQVQLQQAQNLVTLYKVLGGGWKESAAP